MSENKNVPSSLHYPKARVILGFLLMGGGLGGWLFWATLGLYNALGWYGKEAFQGSGDFVDLVPGFFLLGSVFGFIPSVLCGWWLAENRFCYAGWCSLWLPLVSGLLISSVVFIWLPPLVLLTGPCGALSAVILARILCPKGLNNEAA